MQPSGTRLTSTRLANISLFILAGIILTSILVYPSMPSIMPTHWNIHGQPDIHLPRFHALLILPLIASALLLLFNYLSGRKDIDAQSLQQLSILTILFLFFLHIGTILNTRYQFNFNYFIIPLISIFLYTIGYLMKSRNPYIGIRTPWTLASEKVWNKTHKTGSFVFRLIPLALLLGLIIPDAFLFILLGTIAINIIFFLAYSYLLYKSEVKK